MGGGPRRRITVCGHWPPVLVVVTRFVTWFSSYELTVLLLHYVKRDRRGTEVRALESWNIVWFNFNSYSTSLFFQCTSITQAIPARESEDLAMRWRYNTRLDSTLQTPQRKKMRLLLHTDQQSRPNNDLRIVHCSRS